MMRRLGDARLVAEMLELRGGVGGPIGRLPELIGLGQHRQLGLEARRPRLQPVVADGMVAELLHQRPPVADVARRQERFAGEQQQVGHLVGVDVERDKRPVRVAARGGEVVALQCRVGGTVEKGGSLATRGRGARVVVVELLAVEVGLLEVVGDHHVEVAGEVFRRRLHPRADLEMQIGSGALEQPSVRGVADQHVVEPDDRFVAPVGAGRLDLLLAAQPLDHGVEIVAAGVGQQRGQGAERELRPDDRRQLEHPSLGVGEALDAGGEQRLDRRRHLDRLGVDGEIPTVSDLHDHAVVDEHPHQLADEQRVAVGRVGQAGGELLGECGATEQFSGEQFGRRGVEAFERHDGGHPPAGLGEWRADVADLRAGQPDHQHRRRLRPLGEMFEQVEEQRLRPLDVVDHQHQRLAFAEDLDQSAHGEERILGRPGCGGADERAQQLDEPGGASALVADQRPQRLDDLVGGRVVVEAGDRLKQFRDRRERRRAGTLAAQLDEAGVVADRPPELAGETASCRRRATRSRSPTGPRRPWSHRRAPPATGRSRRRDRRTGSPSSASPPPPDRPPRRRRR